MRMTRTFAYAIGLDAGNRSMATAGRKTWNEQDYDAATAATVKALALLEAKP